ncbi:MAG: VCBS repeat-containing protein [Bacteroidetes bacterium]|nr:VCBS repeat-containing protein [Bacteroidota bacterium]
MKRIFISILLILFFLANIALGQGNSQTNHGSNIILSNEFAGGQHLYKASESIRLLPGFRFSAESKNDFFIGELDPNIIIPPASGTIGGPEVDDIGVVGTLVGEHAVTPLGSANLSVPISLPSGINNMTPVLGFTYNSQARNSLLGMGWSLAGLSAISRSNSTIFHDGFTNNVNFNEWDRFNIDGQRLMVTSGEYGTGNSEYKCEFDNFSKIVYTKSGIGLLDEMVEQNDEKKVLDYFVVYRKDGTIWHYGNNLNSIVKHPNGKILLWMVSRISDRMGNYIDFVYEHNTDGTLGARIKSILYTGNSINSTSPFYFVNFSYEDRIDVEYKYFAGAKFSNSKRLNNIKVNYSAKVNGEATFVKLFQYNISYEIINGVSHINRIWQQDDKGNQLNPMRFSYGNGSDLAVKETNGLQKVHPEEYGAPSDRRYYYYGDFNGNGFTDYIESNYNGKNIKLYLNQKNGNFLKVWEHNYNDEVGFNELLWIYVTDINGDGKDDIVRIISNVNGATGHIIVKPYLYTNNGFNTTPSGSVMRTNVLVNNTGNNACLGDFDGNGKFDDLIIKTQINKEYKPFYYAYYKFKSTPGNPSGQFVEIVSDGIVPFNNDIWGNRAILGNFTGDSRTSIYLGSLFLLNDFREDGKPILSRINFSSGVSGDGYFTGDFNGDGLTDVLSYSQHSPHWRLHFNNGAGFDEYVELVDFLVNESIPQSYYNTNWLNSNEASIIRIADFTGNGKSDILFMKSGLIGSGSSHNTPDSPNTCAFINKMVWFENNIESSLSFIRRPITDIYVEDICNYMGLPQFPESLLEDNLLTWANQRTNGLGDFDGDGRIDLITGGAVLQTCSNGALLINPTHFQPKIISFQPWDDSHLLTEIKDAFGNKTEVFYSVLTDSEVYSSTANSSFSEIINIIAPITVVKSIIKHTPYNANHSEYYQYHNAKFHHKARGFLGFEKITSTFNNGGSENLVNVSENYVNSEYALLYEKSVLQKVGSNNLLSKSFNNWQFRQTATQSNPITGKNAYSFFYYPDNTISSMYEPNSNTLTSRTTENFVFDIYANLTQHKIVYANVNLEQISDISYKAPDLENWVIGLPLSKVSTQKFIGDSESTLTSKTQIEYSTQSGKTHLPVRIHSIPQANNNDPLRTLTTIEYDNFGNMVSQLISAPNDPETESRIIEFEYSEQTLYRFPNKITDGLGHETIFTYNSFYGWKKSETAPNGLITVYNLDLFGISNSVAYADGTSEHIAKRWAKNHTDAPSNALFYTWQQTTGSTPIIVFYNSVGQQLRVVTRGFNNEKIYTDFTYNSKGLLISETLPYFANGAQILSINYEYDAQNRKTKTTLPDGSVTRVIYSASPYTPIVKVVNALNQQSEQRFNSVGWLTRSIDANNKSVQYSYFADGKLKEAWIQGQEETKVNLNYNSIRARKEMHDPNYGLVETEYSPFGEIIEIKNPKEGTQSFKYDVLGRVIEKVRNNGTNITQFDYVTEGNGIGLIQEVSSENHGLYYVYDNFSRVSKTIETINNVDFETRFVYDDKSRIANIVYASGFGVKHVYNGFGHLFEIRGLNDNKLLWKTNKVNQYGQIEKYEVGNALITDRVYDNINGNIKSIRTHRNSNNFQDYVYNWDKIGNLVSRKKWLKTANNQSLIEEFSYDNLSRLTSIALNGNISSSIEYDATGLGNIIHKNVNGFTFISEAIYGEEGSGPHALTSFSSNSISDETQNIEYTHLDKIWKIREGNNLMEISYGVNDQRIHQIYDTKGDLLVLKKEKIFAGLIEQIIINKTIIETWNYISGPEGVFAVYVQDRMGSGNYYYIHKDHLGSWELITDENRNIVQNASFDAWGLSRDPDTWTWDPDYIAPALRFDRGYTGHEHLPQFNLINMNGRVYDPKVSRFLSPDPYIQSPAFTQSYNRYAYCLNNPMKYIDPSGYQYQSAVFEWWKINGQGQSFWYRGDYVYNSNGSYMGTSGYNYGGGGGGGIGNPGQFFNGLSTSSGVNGIIYDWHTKTYRNIYTNEIVSFGLVFNNIILPRAISITHFIYTGTKKNPYQVFRGFHFSNGTEWYTEDGFFASSEADDSIWNSRPMRILLPDNISVNFTFAGGFIFGSMTYSINFLIRGKTPGVYLSKTEMDKVFGMGFLSGPSIGLHYYQKNINELNYKHLFGRTQSGAGAIIWGGGAQFPHNDNGELMWIGIDVPFFPGIGGMGGTGYTSPTWE